LVLNEKFNNLLFNQEGKFLHYIISYSNHTPFTNKKGVCKMLYEMDNEQILLENPEVQIEEVEMTEEECVRRQAQETDYMMQLLLEQLEEKEMLDDTVFVVFADHYLYTLEDKTLLDKYKNTSNNLINNTPFFIWSTSTKKYTISKPTSQLNILPTTLNLFGIEYNPNNYISQDALSKNYNGVVFFSDYSWYDGNVYVSDGTVVNNQTITQENLIIKNDYVSYVAKKIDLALRYDYFKETK
jgi:phosphoglycerol transferase MdoB-like AlkP superfamily enzyme